MQGEDEPECLTASWTTPCKTLSYVLTAGHTVVCMNGTFHNISDSVKIINITSDSHEFKIVCISCLIEDSEITLYSSSGKSGHVSFINFTMKNTNIQMKNMYAIFKNVVLGQVIIHDFESTLNHIYIEGATLSCFHDESCGLSLLNSSIVKFVISRSHLNNFKLDLKVENIMLFIDDTIFVKPYMHVSVLSAAYRRTPAFIQFYNLTVTVAETIDSSPTSLRVKRSAQPLNSISEISLDLINPYLYITRCSFSQTHLQIAARKQDYSQAYFFGAIADSNFSNSYHDGDGGALSIGSDVPHSRLIISSCIFTNTTAVKGFSANKGHGGGITITAESLQVELNNSQFTDNKADDVGLAFYTSEGVTVSLSNCSFKYTVDPIKVIVNLPNAG